MIQPLNWLSQWKPQEGKLSILGEDYHSMSLPSAEKKSDLNLIQRGHHPYATSILCYLCGGQHFAPQCKHKDVICHLCEKRSHLACVCRFRGSQKTTDHPLHQNRWKTKLDSKSNNYMDEEASFQDEIEPDVLAFSGRQNKSYRVMVTLNNVPVHMELDTGAAVSVISDMIYNDIQH